MKLQDFKLFDVVEMDYYIDEDRTERIVSLVIDTNYSQVKFKDIVANENDEWAIGFDDKLENIKIISVWNLKNRVLNELPELAI